jgi:hypothetical protein
MPLGETPPLEAGEIPLIVSIDTEEDNWVPTRDDVRVENARELPRLQAFFDRLHVRPTYFVANSIAADPTGSRITGELFEMEGVEIGAHLHPWNTPPLDEDFVPRHTMLWNLPADLQRKKLEHLTATLQRCLGGWQPHSFRAGRWGMGAESIAVLLACGYTIDSSVTPHTSWEDHSDGPSHIGAPIEVYRLDPDADLVTPVSTGEIIEVPPSFGFNRSPMRLWARIHQGFSSTLGRALSLDRIAGSTGFLRWITLSPETDTVDDMLALTKALLASGARHLHMYFHSPSLCPGMTPFVRTTGDLDRFYAAIEEYLERVTALTRIRFATVSETAAFFEPDDRRTNGAHRGGRSISVKPVFENPHR